LDANHLRERRRKRAATISRRLAAIGHNMRSVEAAASSFGV
jgi:hypothetical protein